MTSARSDAVLSSRSAEAVRIGLILLLAGLTLLAMGRPLACLCGHVALWHGALDAENSQQLLDWYSLSHVEHGILFCAATWWAMRGAAADRRLLVATLVEAGWELVENSPPVIARYRAATMALGYTGDTVLNSLSDIACMIVGFLLARRLPVAASVALCVALELAALIAIRDNLALNILMLTYPVPAVKAWQGF